MIHFNVSCFHEIFCIWFVNLYICMYVCTHVISREKLDQTYFLLPLCDFTKKARSLFECSCDFTSILIVSLKPHLNGIKLTFANGTNFCGAFDFISVNSLKIKSYFQTWQFLFLPWRKAGRGRKTLFRPRKSKCFEGYRRRKS